MGTRTYLLQQRLARVATSARPEIMARFTGFFTGLRNAPSGEVRRVALTSARDQRSTTGSIIRVVEEGMSVWSSTTQQVRRAIKEKEAVAVPLEDAWRGLFIQELLEQRMKHY